MKNKLLLTFLIWLTSMSLFSQIELSEPTITKKMPEPKIYKYQKGLGIETFYQYTNGIGLGGIIGGNIGNDSKPNYAAGIYTDVFFLDKPIVGPRVKFTYNYVGIFGVSLNVSDYFRNSMHDVRVGLDLNFSVYGFMTFFVGYSMKFSENSFDEITKFRVGLNLSLVNNRN